MLKPTNDQVLVEEIEQESQTDAGILIPETVAEDHRRGKVVGVGSGQIVGGKRIPIDIQKGDVVMYNRGLAEELTLKGKPYYMLRYPGILGITDKKDSITVSIELGSSVASSKEGLKQSLKMAIDDLNRWSDQKDFLKQLLKNKNYHLFMANEEGYIKSDPNNQ